MTTPISFARGRVFFLSFAFVIGHAQILQDRPDLCGKPGQTIPLPEGTVFNGRVSELTLKLKDGTSKTVDLGVASRVLQVCPIPGDRLLVFGSVAGSDGPHVSIVSQIDGRELDRLGSRGPMVSPDQHWVIYRQFYPPNVQIVAEDYMLYDLTKDAAGNRPPDPQRRPSGREVYPVTADHFRLSDDLALEPTHEFASESFYWSPDSQYVAFADLSQGVMSIVLARMGKAAPTVYTHSLAEGEICASRPVRRGGYIRGADLHNVEFFASQAPLPDIWATFSNCDEPLRLHAQDFKLATVEVHKKIRPPKK